MPRTRQSPGTTVVGLNRRNKFAQAIVAGIDARGWSFTGAAVTRVSTLTNTTSPIGLSVLGNDTRYLYQAFPSSGVLTYPFTVVLVMGNVARTATTNVAGGLGNTAGTQLCGFQFVNSSNNRFLYRNVNGGSILTRDFSTNASSSNVGPVVLSATVNSAASVDIYWNGVLDNGSLTSSTSGDPGMDTFGLGGIKRSTDTPAGSSTNASFGFVTNAGWNAAQHLEYAKTPQQIFLPERRRVGKLAAGATHTTTGAVTGAGATVAGSATHYTKHATTGAVQGAGATVAGAALHPHTTSGAVTGGGAAVAGASDHITPGGIHATIGDVAGAGATVAGTATHLTLHATSGAVQGAGATITGDSAHLTLHTTTGDVAGGGATVTGAASRSGINEARSGVVREWLIQFYEQEWAKPVQAAKAPEPPKKVGALKPAVRAVRNALEPVAEAEKVQKVAPRVAAPRKSVARAAQPAVTTIVQTILLQAQKAALQDREFVNALNTRQQQQRAAEAEEAEDEELLLLAVL